MYEPLDVVAADNPVMCAAYAKCNGLLNTPSWKHFKRIANREKKLTHMINQVRLYTVWHGRRYKYRYEVLHDHADAM